MQVMQKAAAVHSVAVNRKHPSYSQTLYNPPRFQHPEALILTHSQRWFKLTLFILCGHHLGAYTFC